MIPFFSIMNLTRGKIVMWKLQNYTSRSPLFKRLLGYILQMIKSYIQIKIVWNNGICQGINDLAQWLVQLPTSIRANLSQET